MLLLGLLGYATCLDCHVFNSLLMCVCRLSMTAAAGVLTGLAKLKRQDSARSQHRSIPPTSPGLGNPTPETAPR